jgi:hypothetical protein
MSKLIIIKILHTLIWVFFNFLIAYLGYAVIVNRIGRWVWMAVGIILIEGLVLLIFRNKCPLTVIARRYSDSSKDNFDIYLPNWLARNNKLIYTTIVICEIGLLIYRMVNR